MIINTRTSSSFPAAITTICLTVLLGACSTYGWADSTGTDGEVAQPLRVETLSAPAHLGLDHSALRILLIDELELQGVSVAFTGDAPSLRCMVTDRHSSGFGSEVVAELDLACDILPGHDDTPIYSFREKGLSIEHLGADSSSLAAMQASRRSDQLAAADAVTRLAPQIADALRKGSSAD